MGAGPDIADLVRRGIAVVVATRDAELRPELSRAWGPALSDDGERLTVCVEAGSESATARNLGPGSPVAVHLARIASRETVQLKGAVLETGPPTPDRLAVVAAHVDGWVAETARVGVSETVARALVGPDLLTLTIEVGERFVDTPGDGAG